MIKTDLLEIIRNGENSGIEFKRDDIHPDALAKEISALLNIEGGRIVLGVEDDGRVTGLVTYKARFTVAPAELRRKIIQGMRDHNGTEPDLIEEEDRFIVRLWK